MEVGKTDKPIVLSLSSYFTVNWVVRLSPDASLRALIVSGYNEQRVEELGASIPVLMRTYLPADIPGSSREYFAHGIATPESLRS